MIHKPDIRYLAHLFIMILFLFLSFLLQTTVFSRLRIFGVCPLLLPLAVVGYAMFTGSTNGGIFGIFAGILCDISMNEPAVLFTLTLTAVGLITGWIASTFLVKGFPTFLLCSVCTLMLCAFVQGFSLLAFSGVPVFPLMLTAMRQSLCSLLFAIPIYWAAKFTVSVFSQKV